MANSNGKPPRPSRLETATSGGFYSATLVGSYFHSDAKRGWQGCVVAEPTPGTYLVELFSWVMGESTDQQLVRLSEMSDWRFYDDAEWLRNSADAARSRWDRERESAE
ncbi:hypothetical protein ACQPXB_22025 [Amycolatopsis sp. CA-161197]|uniref:hypothetical protein n=1 Tax=Amycolatopsis sp. CA-161197 TaxID=3239922 RepID=UPI003D8AACBB